jgi:hypothetical protein
MRLYRDFHIMVARSEHPHQLFHRNQPKLAAQQLRQVGRLHLNQPGSLAAQQSAALTATPVQAFS